MRTGTRAEWLTERRVLLADEKEHTRRGDELARRRRELPWVPVEKDYRFDTVGGPASLAELFRGRTQLMVQHVMFPGCPSCASMADGVEGFATHLENHDVALVRVSRHPLAQLTAFADRMGWSVPWVSSEGSDFNVDFGVAYSQEQIDRGATAHNMHDLWELPEADRPFRPVADLPGISAFALHEGLVHHTYSAYARGLDGMWSMYQWLDRAPRGRNEDGPWLRLHDEYPR